MRLKIIFVLMIALFIFFNQAPGQKDQIPIALLTLEVAGIDSSAATTLTDRLRAELLQTGEFNVMERNRMEEILTEQGFQQTGACNTDECIVEAGRLLGVTHIAAGSVGKLGTLFTVTVRLIDVETGRILLSATEDSDGPIENVLTISLKNVAQKLSAAVATVDKTLLGFGSLKLNSKPEGARVFIDDQSVSGLTPLTVDSIRSGVHVIRMQKDLLVGSKAIFVPPNEETIMNLELTLAKGSLKIVTEPGEAEIFLDYKSMGFAPKHIGNLPVGSYYLKLVKPGHVDYTQILSIKENETTFITAKLIPMSYLTLTANPPDCHVMIDDSLIGKTPLIEYNLKPGFHKIKVGKTGFISYEETRSIPAGQITTIDVTLDAEARLVINSEPMEAELYIDGIFRGLTPIEVSGLKPGTVNIKLKKELHEDHIAQLNLEKGVIKNVNFTMKKKKGKLIIQSIPSEANVEIDGIARGITPIELSDVVFGKHLIRVIKTGYKYYEKEIEITDHFPQVIDVGFEIAKGTLFLQSTPKDALIFLDGRQMDQIPASGMTLLPGEYHISALRPGYEKFNQIAVVKPNEGHSFEIQLQKKTTGKAILRSVLFPGWGQRYAEKHSRKYLFSIIEVGSLAGILVSDLLYDKKISDYQDLGNKYHNAISEKDIEHYRSAMDDTYSDMKSYQDIRRKFVISAIGIWALNILDSAIFPPIRPEIVEDSYSLSLTLKF